MRNLLLPIVTLASVMCAWGQGMYPGSSHVSFYFPQLADGGPEAARWQTVVTLVSQSPLDGDAVITLYGNDGKPLAIDFGDGAKSQHTVRMSGLGSKTLSSRMKSETTQVGWAVAKSDVLMTATVTFRLWLDGKATQEVSAPPVAPTFAYSSYANKELGVAIGNPSSTAPITLSVYLFDSLGWPAGKSVSITIPALGHTVFNVKDKFPLADMTDWSLYISSTSMPSDPFIAWTMNADASGTFSSIPNGSYLRPASHADNIRRIWSQLIDTVDDLDLFGRIPTLDVRTGSEVNAFAEGGTSVGISLGLAQVLNEADHELAYVMAHQLGHVFQQQNDGMYIWDDDTEKDANLWAIFLLYGTRLDPYAMPGALGQLVAASGASGPIVTWEKGSRAAANTSLKAQFENSWATLTGFCNISLDAQAICTSYNRIYRPNVPKGGAVTTAIPAAVNPATQAMRLNLIGKALQRFNDRRTRR